MLDERTLHARKLFSGIAQRYQWPAEAFSFGQYGRWRRALVGALSVPAGARALDVATGTGLIARDVRERWGCQVVGADQSYAMLANGSGIRVAADARALPFRDGTFDVVTFSYLLRYVEDPQQTLAELSRVTRIGGTVGSVEFGVPAHPVLRAAWRLYTRTAFRWLCALLGAGWREVGRFLGPSIAAWGAAWPIERQARAWQEAGIEVLMARRMSFGGGVVMTGRRR